MDLWRAGVQEAAVLCGAGGEETQVLLPPQEDRAHRRAEQEVRRLSLALAAGIPLLPGVRVVSPCRHGVRCSLDCRTTSTMTRLLRAERAARSFQIF